MDPNRNLLWSRALAEELARCGVRVVALAPGSRSGPLALACAETPGLRVFVHLDERAAAYFALGAARAGRAPAAVVTTSGTAAANLLPAAVEACYGRVPLVLLTADRPPELRGCGAPQTIHQVNLFGAHVRAAAELPVPEAHGPLLRALRATVCRMVAAATGDAPGPVHLNVPFREPLDPRPVPGDVPADLPTRDPLAFHGRPAEPFARCEAAAGADAGAAAGRLAARIRAAARGLLVVGPEDRTPDLCAGVAALARATGYPVLADPCSPLRAGAPEGIHVLAAYDAFLRSDRFAAGHPPDLVVRLGAPPTSKSLTRYLERHLDTGHVLVDAAGAIEDPSHLGPEVLRADPAALGHAVADALTAPVADARFVADFTRAETRARAALDAAAQAGPWFEAGLVRLLDAALPAGTLLYAGSSMPIRELDSFLAARPRPLRILANRGANGIDGVVASALGATAAAGGPGVALVGDLSLLHDSTALIAAHRDRIPLVIVVINNDGGGIFHYLPVREHAARFDQLFATPHGLDLRHLAELYGLPYARAAGDAFEPALRRALAAGGPALLEVPIDRAESARLHQRAWGAAVEAVEAP